MSKTLKSGSKVHYKGDPSMTGTVVRTEDVVKSPRRGSGYNTGNTNGSTAITMYRVTWDGMPDEEDRYYRSELVGI